MSLDIDEMRTLVRRGLGGLDEADLGNDDVDLYLNLALWEIEGSTEFESQSTQITTTLVEGQSDYDISDAATGTVLNTIISVAIVDENNQSFKLQKTTRDWYDEHYNSGADYYAQPERYLREADLLILWPTPDDTVDGNALKISLREGIANIVKGTKDTTGLPRQWDELVVEGAITRGHYYRQDYDLSTATMNIQSRKISKIEKDREKGNVDMHRARLSVIWDEDDAR